jgi:hypothetical protein
MAFAALKFAYKHPTFGRSNAVRATEPFKNTVYYLWWDFLRRSDAYRECCASGGTGKLSSVYEAFGDVFATDFKTWWQTDERGARLFAERLPPKMILIDALPAPAVADQVLVMQVPLALSKRALAAEFQKILKVHHQGKRGRRNNVNSTAMYPVTGHIDTDALQKCLRVYDMRRENPKMTLWQVCQNCKAIQRSALLSDSDTDAEKTSKKFNLTNTAQRLIKKAELIIQKVEQGRFAF